MQDGFMAAKQDAESMSPIVEMTGMFGIAQL